MAVQFRVRGERAVVGPARRPPPRSVAASSFHGGSSHSLRTYFRLLPKEASFALLPSWNFSYCPYINNDKSKGEGIIRKKVHFVNALGTFN